MPKNAQTTAQLHSSHMLVSESEVAQSCLTLCSPMEYSLPGSSIHGIFHARVLEWVASKVMLKILQARLQQYVNCELPDVQASFRKGEEPEIKLPTSARSSKKQESSRKTSISALLTTPKPLTVWITINCGKF